eukprot:COSAG04_NODE_1111_length_8227_cov_4.702510_3_plen_509_part_00
MRPAAEECARLLLEAGADAALRATGGYNEGKTALELAEKYARAEVVALLKERERQAEEDEKVGQFCVICSVDGATARQQLESAGWDVHGAVESWRSDRKHRKQAAMDQLLVAAAETGDAEALEWLLADGADPNAARPSSWSSRPRGALFLAAKNGHVQAVKMLLEGGASSDGCLDVEPAVRATQIKRLLAKAIEDEAADLATVEEMARADQALPHGTQICVEGYGAGKYDGLTPRSGFLKRVFGNDHRIDFPQWGVRAIALRNPLALWGGRAWTVRPEEFWHATLIKGIDLDSAPLVAHSLDRWQAVAETWLVKVRVWTSSRTGRAAGLDEQLRQVAAAGDAAAVERLVKNGASPNASDESDGETALMAAAKYGYADTVVALLRLGADPNATDSNGQTALMIYLQAATGVHASVVAALLQSGAAVDAMSDAGGTALMRATIKNHAKCARLLLEAGADTTLRSKLGRTALGYAKHYGHAEMVALLEEHRSPAELRAVRISEMRDDVRPR